MRATKLNKLITIQIVADSTDANFRGISEGEKLDIEYIRKRFEPYLYEDNCPKELVDMLFPIARNLMDDMPDATFNFLKAIYS